MESKVTRTAGETSLESTIYCHLIVVCRKEPFALIGKCMIVLHERQLKEFVNVLAISRNLIKQMYTSVPGNKVAYFKGVMRPTNKRRKVPLVCIRCQWGNVQHKTTHPTRPSENLVVLLSSNVCKRITKFCTSFRVGFAKYVLFLYLRMWW